MAQILIWDNDGTISGSKDPNDIYNSAKVILPGVKEKMQTASFNFVISGFKSPESEAQNFDPEKVADKFIKLMEQLPINAAAFSPTMGGIACYIVIKKLDNSIITVKAHEDLRYKKFIGDFKKPGIGMFVVMRDIAKEEFNQNIDGNNSVMIGDTWHDEAAALAFGIPFVNASEIHKLGMSPQYTIDS
ncbi:MAG: hypothetical protein K0R02_867 [Rickettsiaceae bacterium]|jgi:histidinol phosphatase-like enzyme|nr:hypothetical protein [Rickettsiaceae bacterium]